MTIGNRWPIGHIGNDLQQRGRELARVNPVATVQAVAQGVGAECARAGGQIIAQADRLTRDGRESIGRLVSTLPQAELFGRPLPGLGRRSPARPGTFAPPRDVSTRSTTPRGELQSHAIELDAHEGGPRINTRLKPPSLGPNELFTQLRGVLAKIEKGSFEFYAQVDERGGELPQADASAPTMRAQGKTLIQLSCRLERDREGVLRVRDVVDELSRPLVIGAGALAKLGKNHPITQLLDNAGSIHFGGIALGNDGRTTPRVAFAPKFPGPLQELAKLTLGENFAIPFPNFDDGKRLDMRAEAFLEQLLNPKKDGAKAKAPELDPLVALSGIMPMVKIGVFRLKGEGATGPINLQDAVDFRAPSTGVRTRIQGKFTGARNGGFAGRVEGTIQSDLVDTSFTASSGGHLSPREARGFVRAQVKSEASKRLPLDATELRRLPIEVFAQGDDPPPIQNGLAPDPREGLLQVALPQPVLDSINHVSRSLLDIPQGDRVHYELVPDSDTRVDFDFVARSGRAPLLENGQMRSDLSFAGASVVGRDLNINLGEGSRSRLEVQDFRVNGDHLTAERAGMDLDWHLAPGTRVRKFGLPADIQQRSEPHVGAKVDFTTDDQGQLETSAQVTVSMAAKGRLGPLPVPVGARLYREGEFHVGGKGDIRLSVNYEKWRPFV